jgi:DNA modification methylase
VLDRSALEGALFHGDNLAWLSRVAPGSVDLVYLDPPFCSQRDYEVRFVREGGRRRRLGKGELEGFSDTFVWGEARERDLSTLGAASPAARRLVEALGDALGPSPLVAYLAFMGPRLAEVSRVLGPAGSLFVHVDPGASHVLRLLLDVLLGPGAFQNEVVWRYRRWPTKARRFQRMHDTLLYYARDPRAARTFHALYGYEPLAESTRRTFGSKRQVADFSSGRRRPGLTDQESAGPPLSDVWEIGILPPSGNERVGYPTQKPEALLERVVRAASSEGDLVLDPFAGSGTTLAVAARLGRRFAGIDASEHAIALADERLRKLGQAPRLVRQAAPRAPARDANEAALPVPA